MYVVKWHLATIAQPEAIFSLAESNGNSIGSKAVRVRWPVLLGQGRSVELAEIPIGAQTVGTPQSKTDGFARLASNIVALF